MRQLVVLLVIFTLSACVASAEPAATTASGLPVQDTAGCLEGPMAQFGRYIGDWAIEDASLSKDGKQWLPGTGARWNFVCLGNGTAVQDFWMPTQGAVGTNLRTYNATTQRWDIAWAVRPAPGFSHIQAQLQADDTIVMEYVRPVPTPQRRITFFPPDSSGWKWTLQISNDAGASWREVYRIRARPWSGE